MKNKKKILILIFALVMLLPNAYVNLSAQAKETNVSNRHLIQSSASRTNAVSQALKAKADKYVKLNNGIFTYVHNAVLTFSEATTVRTMVNEANAIIAQSKKSNQHFYVQSDKSVLITKEKVSSQANGITGINLYWWGFRIFIARDHLLTACQVGADALGNFLTSIIPGLRGMASAIINAITSFILGQICAPLLPHGCWIDFNVVFGITATGWQ